MDANTCYWFYIVSVSEDYEISEPIGINESTLPTKELCWMDILNIATLDVHDNVGQNPNGFFNYDSDCIGCEYLNTEIPIESPVWWNYHAGGVDGGGFDIELTENYDVHLIHLYDSYGNGIVRLSFWDQIDPAPTANPILSFDYQTDESEKWRHIANFETEPLGVRMIRIEFIDGGGEIERLVFCGAPSGEEITAASCGIDPYYCHEDASFEVDVCDLMVTTQSENGIIGDWDMGDGTTLSNHSAVGHTYAVGGNYDITFTVRTPCERTCRVAVELPEIVVLDAEFSDNHSPCNLFATFFPVEEAWDHTWVLSQGGTNLETLEEVSPTFSFPDFGTYTITHTIEALDENGQICTSSTSSQNFVIENCNPNPQCSNCVGGTEIYNDVSSSQIFPQAAGNPSMRFASNTCIEIIGTLTIDGGGLFIKNVDFKMHPGAQVIVQGGAELIFLNNVHFEGCSSMWKGIYFETGARFESWIAPDLEDSSIEDALVAMSFKNPSYAGVRDLVFDKNFIGIHVINGSWGI